MRKELKVSALLYAITSKHKGDFCFLNCLYSFITENTCTSSRKQTKNIIDFGKKKEVIKSHQDAKVCYTCEKRFLKKFANDRNYQKFRDQAIMQVTMEVQHIVFVI